MTHSCARPCRRLAGDSGSVMLLMVGAMVVVLLALVLLADAGAAFRYRRAMIAAADSAALHGALALGRADVVGGRPGAAAAATAAARRSLSLGELQPQPTLERVVVAPDRVSVCLRGALRLPFAGVLGQGEVPVRACATARSGR